MNDEQWVAGARCDEMMDNILHRTRATEWRGFLSDSKENNFRTHLYPFYKANRKQEKPTHYEFLKEHLIVKWGAEIAHGMEADDALGINQDNLKQKTARVNVKAASTAAEQKFTTLSPITYASLSGGLG